MKKYFNFIFSVYGIMFILGFSGVLLIYGSRLSSQYDLGAAALAFKQFCFLLLGFIFMDRMRRIKKEQYSALSRGAFLAALILLWGVLIMGVKVNGMRGWYSLYYLYLQPSEIFKFVYVLHISNIYMQTENKEKAFIHSGILSVLWIGAILLQPDYGTALLYCFTFAVISFLGGVKMRVLLLLPAAALASLLVFIGRKEYGFERLYGFFSENADVFGSAWHWKQFQLAIARGGWFGMRIDGAFWSNNYLPFAYNDSAYAALHEMLGICGAAVILILYFVLFYLIYRQSLSNKYSLIILSGAGSVMVNVLLHCSVNCALIPTTGVTLPLISYGGSSLVGTFLIIGMLLAFCRDTGDADEICS